MISVKCNGDFKKTRSFLERIKSVVHMSTLDKYGKQGVTALSQATPKDSGLTATSWSYTISRSNGTIAIEWNNSNIQNGCPIAVILQYGHGTGNGGYVQGRDYINPAMRPVFDKILDDMWKEVQGL